MAKCAGCSAVGCSCVLTVMDTASLDLTLSGDGSAATPWVLSGIAAGGGGGSCAQKNVYTVATPSTPILPGFGLATPEPFFSCADFIGDGANDAVAIQAAIDAAVAHVPPGGFPTYPVVELLSGFFILDAVGVSINPKGVWLRGQGTDATGLTPLLAVPGRVFDIPASPAQNNRFSDFSMASGGGSAIFKASTGTTVLERMVITATLGSGVDVAGVHVETTLLADDCSFSGSHATLAASAVRCGPGSRIVDNTFSGLGLLTRGDASTGVVVLGNRLTGITNPQDWAIGVIGAVGVNSVRNLVANNIIRTTTRHGIVLERAVDSIINNNMIDGYDSSNTLSFDGIHLRTGSSTNTIEGNKVRQTSFGGRFAINVSTVDCTDNFVTNNDLFNAFGMNDAGVFTITSPGNRV